MSAAAPPLPDSDLSHVLAHTRALWGELRGGRIFITGGTGFFGCWLLETFCHANSQLDLGAQAVVLSRDPGAFRRKMPHLFRGQDVQVIGGDVRSFPFPDGTFTHVIHAGTTSSAPVQPLEMFETIVGGTRRVLEFAVACGVRQMLFTSSGAIYGKQPPQVAAVGEECPGGPDPADENSAYAEGKRAAELLCAAFHQAHGLQVKIARCFAFVGPHLPLDAHFAIGNFIRDALRGDPIRVNGDGTPLRSYLYAADLAIWLWTILFNAAPARPFNVGSSESISIGDVARVVGDVCASGGGVKIAREPLAGALPSRYVPCTDRARSELTLETWIGLREAVANTAHWHRLNG